MPPTTAPVIQLLNNSDWSPDAMANAMIKVMVCAAGVLIPALILFFKAQKSAAESKLAAALAQQSADMNSKQITENRMVALNQLSEIHRTVTSLAEKMPTTPGNSEALDRNTAAIERQTDSPRKASL